MFFYGALTFALLLFVVQCNLISQGYIKLTYADGSTSVDSKSCSRGKKITDVTVIKQPEPYIRIMCLFYLLSNFGGFVANVILMFISWAETKDGDSGLLLLFLAAHQIWLAYFAYFFKIQDIIKNKTVDQCENNNVQVVSPMHNSQPWSHEVARQSEQELEEERWPTQRKE